jgi:hypothetical protein
MAESSIIPANSAQRIRFIIASLLCVLGGVGALPQTPFKKLFEKSFLKVFKNFFQLKTAF